MLSEHLIEANALTPAGRVMRSQAWGEATSIPPDVDMRVCLIPLRDGVVLWNATDVDIVNSVQRNSTAFDRYLAV